MKKKHTAKVTVLLAPKGAQQRHLAEAEELLYRAMRRFLIDGLMTPEEHHRFHAPEYQDWLREINDSILEAHDEPRP